MPEIRTMKIVVGIMTLSILVMLGLVFYGINRNMGEAGEKLAAAATWNKTLPAGAQPLSLSAAGNSLSILADTAEGRRIYVYDLQSGNLRGTLTSSAH